MISAAELPRLRPTSVQAVRTEDPDQFSHGPGTFMNDRFAEMLNKGNSAGAGHCDPRFREIGFDMGPYCPAVV